MMKQAILDFASQFQFEPRIENMAKMGRFDKFVVCGMGGSHLAADLLKRWDQDLQVQVHSNYGLPAISENDKHLYLYIFSSYSGNTEEVINGYLQAKAENLNIAVITVGGKLLEYAKEDKLPYIRLPDTSIQPRSALGFNFISLLRFMCLEKVLPQAARLADMLKPEEYEQTGAELSRELIGKVPIIYSSQPNRPIAYNWKIKFNETGKIPAFFNTFPELNHNEMTGFDVEPNTEKLSSNIHFIFLHDAEDQEKIQKRMRITERLYSDRGLSTGFFEMTGNNILEKIFKSLLVADWVALYIADHYGLESEQVPMVEEFKKMI